MILAHSIKNILRSSWKSLLFWFLIFLLTLLLCFCISAWEAVDQHIENCDESYTTIALFEYMGSSYPDETVYDEYMQTFLDEFDFSIITDNEHVIEWDRSERALGYVEGFTRSDALVPHKYSTVLVIDDVSSSFQYGQLGTDVAQSIYSFNDVENKSLLFYPMEYEFDPDKNYILHGEFYYGKTSYKYFRIASFINSTAINSGFDAENEIMVMEVPAEGDLRENAAYSKFFSIADTYKVINNSVSVFATSSLESNYLLHQQFIYLSEGRDFTNQEYNEGSKVCVITESIANKCNVSIGDVLPISIAVAEETPVYETYWAEKGFQHEDEYTIVGILNTPHNMSNYVYIPKRDDLDFTVNQIGYTVGQAVIKNDYAFEFYNDIKDKLPANIRVTLYDQGYTTVAAPFKNIRSIVKVITWICIFVGIAVLAMFGFIFVYRQREVSEIMQKLGAGKRKTYRYFLFNSGLIAVLASAFGILIGYYLSGYIFGMVKSTALDMFEPNAYYSVGNIAVSKAFDFTPNVDFSLYMYIGLAVILTAILFCVVFTISTFLLKKKKTTKSKTYKKPRKLRYCSKGLTFKYAVLSIFRGKSRGLIVSVISFVVVIFLSQLSHASLKFETQLDEVYSNTTIQGQFTDIYGKSTDRLMLKSCDLDELFNSGYVDDYYVAHYEDYHFLGVSKTADGQEFDVPSLEIPQMIYARETLEEKLKRGSEIIYTNNVYMSPEFIYNTDVDIEFMEGYDLSVFTTGQGDVLNCIVTNSFLEENNLEYGDTIKVTLTQMEYREIDLHVIGSFVKHGNKDNIYCQLGWDYTLAGVNNESPEGAEDAVDFTYHSANFTVSSANLDEFRVYLYDKGYSEARHIGVKRDFILLYDAEFNNTVQSIQRQITLINILYPFLYFLVGVIGLILSYLLIFSRIKEFAIMRIMGANKFHTFLSFFIEQAVLCLLGCVAGLIGWYIYEGNINLLQCLLVIGFMICYFVGTIMSIVIMNRKTVLSILREEE